MFEHYPAFIAYLSNFLYTYLLPLLLIGGGIYFSFYTGWVQLRLLGEAIRVVKEPAHNKTSLSSFRALMVSTASRVGTGNIVGVSAAICLGGPGAVFWMWLIALIGASSAFIESTLAQIYKKRDVDGSFYGGPAYYIENGLKNKKLGVLFACILILTYLVGFNMLCAYNIDTAFQTYSFYHPRFTPLIIGAVLAFLAGISIFGGGRRLAAVTAVLVPLMSVLYILVSVVIIIKNATLIPQVFQDIFRSAFDWPSILGGFTGSALMLGLKRGLFSNEAGIGSAPNAAASADTSHPVKQGLVQMLSVYIDTWIICTATAFMLLLSGVAPNPAFKGAQYNVAALVHNFGSFGQHILTVALCLFGFTTLIGNYFYSESNLKYLFNRPVPSYALLALRLSALAFIFVGTGLDFQVAWDTADVLMACMALINIPAIFLLRHHAKAALDHYRAHIQRGHNPQFKARDIQLPDQVDDWQ